MIGLQAGLVAAGTLPAGDEAAGQRLAERIRSAMPTNDSEIRGTLLVDSKSVHLQVPLVCQVHAHTNEGLWETVYQTFPTNQIGGHVLVIIHHLDAPNQFVYDRQPVLSAAAEDVPFADSDFSLGELGLEFLHWSGQSQLPSQKRSGRPCYVLESTKAGGQIARITSWIDQESLNPLDAEAYDGNENKLKEYSLGGSTRVEKLEIRKLDPRTKKTLSHTVLKFDIPKN